MRRASCGGARAGPPKPSRPRSGPTQFLAHPLAPDLTIERILGRPPHTFAQWLKNHLDAFR
jgi:hypothetical protein